MLVLPPKGVVVEAVRVRGQAGEAMTRRIMLPLAEDTTDLRRATEPPARRSAVEQEHETMNSVRSLAMKKRCPICKKFGTRGERCLLCGEWIR